MYTEALSRKAEATDTGAAPIDVLRVADLVRPDHVAVAPDLPLPRLLDAFVAARRNHCYLAADGRFAGAANLHDVNEALRGTSAPESVLARDVARSRFETTTPEESLPRVLQRFAEQECERLPVLADRESSRLVGTISKRDILSVYALELVQRGGGTRRAGTLDPREESTRSSTRCRFRRRSPAARSRSRASASGSRWPCCSSAVARRGRWCRRPRCGSPRGTELVVFGTPDRLAAMRRSDAAAPHS